jgi:RimJ/RimL family protein N-acetyltransferase
MKVYNISETEINKFTSLSKDSDTFSKTVKSFWTDGLSSPEWCFVVEKKGKIVGRIGFWASPKNKKDIRIFGLELPWNDNILISNGKMLLNKCLQKMKTQGAKFVSSQIHSDDEGFDLSKQLYEQIGMEQSQSKKRFYITKKLYDAESENRLKYKSLDQTGENTFVETIKEVTKETLDQDDKTDVAKFGAGEAARNYFNLLKDLDFSIEDWFLAYHKNKIIGLIIPQELGRNFGAINYIGVIPAERGKGYVIDLLNKGVKNLFNRNLNRVVADIDVLNYPMGKALQEVGFIEEKIILNYRLFL